jgi:protein-disulfide isomerase
MSAAEAGETAHAQGRFWEFHDYVYSLQGDFDQENLGKMLEAVGVDASQYEQAHKDARYVLEIKHDIEDGVQAGVTGVPAIFINGRYTSGTFAYEKLREMVEEELQAASPKAEKEADSLP